MSNREYALFTALILVMVGNFAFMVSAVFQDQPVTFVVCGLAFMVTMKAAIRWVTR